MALLRTDGVEMGDEVGGGVVVGTVPDSSNSDGNGNGRVTLKSRSRGRPRNPATDPTAALILRPATKRQQHSVRKQRARELPVEGIDRYLDAEYLIAERRRRYLPQDFHIAIKNEHDHEADPVKVRLHPSMRAAMDELVNSKEFPIGSMQDILRVGAFDLMRKLYHIMGAGQRVTNWMHILKSQSDMIYMSEQHRAFSKQLEHLRIEVAALKKIGAFGLRQAAVLVVQMRASAKQMARDSAWGEWYLEQIDEEFGELVRSQEQRVRIRRGE